MPTPLPRWRPDAFKQIRVCGVGKEVTVRGFGYFFVFDPFLI